MGGVDQARYAEWAFAASSSHGIWFAAGASAGAGGESLHAGIDRQGRGIDPAKLLRAGLDMDELFAIPRNIEQGIALAWHLAKPRANGEQEIGLPDALQQRRFAPMPRSPAKFG